jgi:molybdopterin-guanine dinucleotide biosynthesis protein
MTKRLPELPEAAPTINGFKYKSQFGVIVVCKDEEEHRKVYDQLARKGYKVRAVRV